MTNEQLHGQFLYIDKLTRILTLKDAERNAKDSLLRLFGKRPFVGHHPIAIIAQNQQLKLIPNYLLMLSNFWIALI